MQSKLGLPCSSVTFRLRQAARQQPEASPLKREGCAGRPPEEEGISPEVDAVLGPVRAPS